MSRRFQQHAQQKGAKYFRGRQPQSLLYVETGHNRSSASKREMAIKRLNRKEKLQLTAEPDTNTMQLSGQISSQDAPT